MIKQQSSGKWCTTGKRCTNLEFKKTGLAFECSQDFKFEQNPFRNKIEVEKNPFLACF